MFENITLSSLPGSDLASFSSVSSPAPSSLGNTQATFPHDLCTAEDTRQTNRRLRYKLRSELQCVTKLERLKKCGNTPVQGGGVVLRMTSTAEGNRAGFSGLSTCGSVHSCPVCSAKISAGRAEELTQIIDYAKVQGVRVAMATLTVSHRKEDSLKSVQKAVQDGWHAVTSGRAWQRFKEAHGLIGWVKATEVTHGANGWHVHLHTLIFFREGKPGDMMGHIWRGWKRGISKTGFRANATTGGLDLQEVQGSGSLGAYLTKQSNALAQEAVLGAFKQGRHGNMTPFQTLAYALETGDVEALEAWYEYEKGTHGKKQLTWSKGLREWASMAEERTDEELAQEELGTSSDDLVLLSALAWKKLKKHSWVLLNLAENLGAEGLKAWLTQKGYSWKLPPSKRPDPNLLPL